MSAPAVPVAVDLPNLVRFDLRDSAACALER